MSQSTTYRERTYSSDEITPIEEDILAVVAGKELYALQICTAFEEVSNGVRRMSLGTLYPILNRLESKGMITSRMQDKLGGGARRKYFCITARGNQALAGARLFREELAAWRPL